MGFWRWLLLGKRQSDKTYLDDNGYYRFKDTDKLVHRWVAYKEIYLEDREKYPLPFNRYIVHHKNHNKRDNDARNLEIVTDNEHKWRHPIKSFKSALNPFSKGARVNREMKRRFGD